MHSLKKMVVKHAKPTGAEPSAEFQSYKLRLEAVSKNLTMADKRMDEAKAHWLKHVMDQRAFSGGYVEGIADSTSETYEVAQEFAEGSNARYDHFVRETNPADAPYNMMHEQLKEYLLEIKEVEKMYKKLADAKSEAGRYQSKIDGMEKAAKTDDIRKERNLEKLDTEKENFLAVQREVTNAQKAVYAKSDAAQKMALVAYWQMNAEHVKVMQASLERTEEYCAENYDELAGMNLLTLEADDVVESPTRAPLMPASLATPPKKERTAAIAC